MGWGFWVGARLKVSQEGARVKAWREEGGEWGWGVLLGEEVMGPAEPGPVAGEGWGLGEGGGEGTGIPGMWGEGGRAKMPGSL